MIDLHKNNEEFDEIVHISSNIKANKRTIIGKFDLRDLIFLMLAGIIGILVLTVVVYIFGIKNIIIILPILSIFEIPIITLGFMKTYNMSYIDYLKLKDKSNNSSYRNQTIRRKRDKGDKFLVTIECPIDKISSTVNDLYKIIKFNNIQIKLINNISFITFEIRDKEIIDKLEEILYKELYEYLSINKDIKYVGINDIKNYEKFLKPIKLLNKKYDKKSIEGIGKAKKIISNIKTIDIKNNRYSNLTNILIDNYKKEFMAVYKIILYKQPFNFEIIKLLTNISELTIYANATENFNINDISYVNTYILIIGSEKEINRKKTEVINVLTTNNVLYKEMIEPKIKETLFFIMENKY